MSVIIIPFSPYIKKEDAKKALKAQRINTGIVFLIVPLIFEIINYFAYPKLIEIYSDFNSSIPFMVRYFQTIATATLIFFGLAACYLFFKEPDYSSLNEKLKKYKTGEMINRGVILNDGYLILGLVAIGVFVGLLTVSIIVPIYELTSQF